MRVIPFVEDQSYVLAMLRELREAPCQFFDDARKLTGVVHVAGIHLVKQRYSMISAHQQRQSDLLEVVPLLFVVPPLRHSASTVCIDVCEEVRGIVQQTAQVNALLFNQD